jgi:bacterioferritin-associated ferredoxin
MNEIVKIKERIQAEINKIHGITATMIILPGKTPCGRCYELARIIQEVQYDLPDLDPVPVCGSCAQAAKELGLQVREIV